MSDSGRNTGIDFSKAVLMILVIFGHGAYFGDFKAEMLQLHDLIYTFHMRAFLFFSGYLGTLSYMRSASFRSGLKNLIRKIVVPYMIFHTLYVVSLYFAGKSGALPTTNAISSIDPEALLRYTFVDPQGVYWYLEQLMYYFLFVHLSFTFGGKKPLVALALLSALVAGFTMLGMTLNLYLVIGTVLAVGGFKLRGSFWSIIAAAALLYYATLDQARDIPLLTLLLVANIVSLLMFIGERFKDNKLVKSIAVIGKHTMPIYVLHPYFLIFFKLSAVRGIFLGIDSSGILHIVVATFLTIDFCLLFAFILEKMGVSDLIFGRSGNIGRDIGRLFGNSRNGGSG